ncbi:hypothetical protein GCM10010421_08870 [Streptomyces glaucus]|uniref:Secreted protein n=1 Tax=Streptomyces glaucus TaxID=284029 RepID=A0ABN3JAG9_9ACTN
MRFLRLVEGGGGGADLEDVALESGEGAPLDHLRQPQLGQPRPVGLEVLAHRRKLHLLPARALPRTGRDQERIGLPRSRTAEGGSFTLPSGASRPAGDAAVTARVDAALRAAQDLQSAERTGNATCGACLP